MNRIKILTTPGYVTKVCIPVPGTLHAGRLRWLSQNCTADHKFVHTDTERKTEMYRQEQRSTDRQTDRQTKYEHKIHRQTRHRHCIQTNKMMQGQE